MPMITRRALLSAGAGTVGAAILPASAKASPPKQKQSGPSNMAKNLTLLSIRHKDGSETLGIKADAGIIDVKSAAKALHSSPPLTLDEMLQQDRAHEIEALKELALKSAKQAIVPERDVVYGRLFANPGKIVCIGLNYRRHAKEVNMPLPKQPVLFSKFNNALAPHQCTIQLPPPEVSVKFDYETELLIVMGKTAKFVPEDKALDYVAGYCTSNDFSARDLQLETGGQWLAGKSLDNFAPIGPYFVSADQIPDPNNLALKTWVNGEIRQDWTTSDFIFNCQQMISYISRIFPLEPGDIIFTGTPHGVVLGMPKEKQVWLKSGDAVVSEIEKLGRLSFVLA
jgi:2-keto-4-pentenoate hydratase/2-oxohepta-3-ene-1,7-dioic acid hydratase in catechol pathway